MQKIEYSRSATLRGAMSPNPTVEKMVLMK